MQARPGARRDTVVVACVLLAAAAVVERLHNAWVAPVLSGYDAFGHFTYIWFVAKTGTFPMPTHGWSFFHPPLFYALMAGIWNALAPADPFVRLKFGKVLVAALGCIQAPIAWYVVGRAFPAGRAVRAMASALVVAVPVQLYSAGFLGNEGLHAVFGSLSILALLRLVDAPSAARAAVLGALLGIAMLAKFSALAIVVGSFAAIAVLVVARRGVDESHAQAASRAARLLATTAVVTLVVAGPWFARNLAGYGTPFELSRKTFPVSYVENNQPQAARGVADYLTFDPLIFRRPVWPRDSTASSDPAPHDFSRAVRESVWTGMYANTWFDGFGGWVLPPVVESEGSRRAGQALLVLGLLPTLLVVVGWFRAVARLRRDGHDDDRKASDTTVALTLVCGAMIALLVQGTITVPIAAAVKATYFTPIAVCFAYFFAHGVVWLGERSRALVRVASAGFVLLMILGLAVFWQGFLFDPAKITSTIPHFDDDRIVQNAIVEYAGGRADEAATLFSRAAESDNPLALENLGFLAIDEGHPHAGLTLLRRASRLARREPVAPIDGERFRRLTDAEYQHSIAVALHDIGHSRHAVTLWQRALRRDPEHSEALTSLAVTRLEDALNHKPGEAARVRALDDARAELAIVRGLDPGLDDGWVYGAAVEAARGDCDAAAQLLDAARARPCWIQRRFPAETGNGAGHSASIGRHRMITPAASKFDRDAALGGCRLSPELAARS